MNHTFYEIEVWTSNFEENIIHNQVLSTNSFFMIQKHLPAPFENEGYLLRHFTTQFFKFRTFRVETQPLLFRIKYSLNLDLAAKICWSSCQSLRVLTIFKWGLSSPTL